VSGQAIYRTPIAPEWIDYNGHVRDAYYGLIVSYALDAMMDQLGMDAAYRKQSDCTLYTVETHTHFLREISAGDSVEVRARVLGDDAVRLHAALELVCDGSDKPAATCEVMMVHVCQTPTVRKAPFPAQVAAAIAQLRQTTAAMPADGPGSRHMEVRSR
jgi:acyl-CoA thioester hydrolase